MDPVLAKLIQEYPLRTTAERERVAKGDLDFAIRAYRRLAAHHGRENHWCVWLYLVEKLGRDFDEEFEEILKDDRRWLALWLFDTGRTELACKAYRRFLDSPGPHGPFTPDNIVYLKTLFQRNQFDKLVITFNELEARFGSEPHESFWAAKALLQLGKPADAIRLLDQAVSKYNGLGFVWALSAVFTLEAGLTERAHADLREAARLGIDHEDVRLVCEAFRLAPKNWAAYSAEHLLEPQSLEEATLRHLKDPGFDIEECHDPSAHNFGGLDFEMPDCLGCGHKIRQWFSLDLDEIAHLKEQLPSWTLFPLLGCVDCSAQLGRHDYRIKNGQVFLQNVALSLRRFGEADSFLADIPRIPVHLVSKECLEHPTKEQIENHLNCRERPQVGGAPRWVQQPELVLCPRCREEMVFVAAMASTGGFGPYIAINNDGGYQYHFACDRCRTLSVIPQYT